jgi:hypothetical protein
MVSLPLISTNLATLMSQSNNPVVAVIIDANGCVVEQWSHYNLCSVPQFILKIYFDKVHSRAKWVQKNHCLTRRTFASSGIIFPNGDVGIVMEWDDINRLIPV